MLFLNQIHSATNNSNFLVMIWWIFLLKNLEPASQLLTHSTKLTMEWRRIVVVQQQYNCEQWTNWSEAEAV